MNWSVNRFLNEHINTAVFNESSTKKASKIVKLQVNNSQTEKV